MRLSRRPLVLFIVGVAVTAMTACSSDDEATQDADPDVRAGVYVGAVAFAGDRIAFDLARPDENGLQRVRAFVTDGTQQGDAEWFEGTARGGIVELTAMSGNVRLRGTVADMRLDGSVTLADGTDRRFHTVLATHGAGIYQVTVTPEGRFTGTSESGDQLLAQQRGVFVEGTITTPRGERFEYRDADMSRAFGSPTPGNQPGTYTVVVSCRGLTQVGRGGAIDQGVTDANFINLDLGASTVDTPGVWYGKVEGGTDQLGMLLGEPSPEGVRSLRVYLSDGEPEPEGDVEWFAGDMTGDIFNLTSVSKAATIAGQIGPAAMAGQVTLPGQPPRRVFAVPAGDGAGIYEVTVSPDRRYEGKSEQGGSFSFEQTGDQVSGFINTPDGRQVPLTAYDLTQVFDYPVEGSRPGAYLTLASPSGRSLTGRSGDVRGGAPGPDLIALDQAC